MRLLVTGGADGGLNPHPRRGDPMDTWVSCRSAARPDLRPTRVGKA